MHRSRLLILILPILAQIRVSQNSCKLLAVKAALPATESESEQRGSRGSLASPSGTKCFAWRSERASTFHGFLFVQAVLERETRHKFVMLPHLVTHHRLDPLNITRTVRNFSPVQEGNCQGLSTAVRAGGDMCAERLPPGLLIRGGRDPNEKCSLKFFPIAIGACCQGSGLGSRLGGNSWC